MSNLYRITALIGLLLLGMVSTAYSATFTVTTTEDTFDGKCNSHCSLREAIQAANETSGGDVIYVPAGTYRLTRTGSKENANNRGDLDVRGSVAIAGEGREKTIIDGIAKDRVLHIQSGDVQITNLTIQNGELIESNGYGAGVYVEENAKVTLSGVIIQKNNELSNGGSTSGFGGGGGIFSFGDLTIKDSSILNNVASHGGGGIGIQKSFASKSAPTLQLIRVNVKDNYTNYFGGGVLAMHANVSVDTSNIESNKVADGSGAANGGGIYSYDVARDQPFATNAYVNIRDSSIRFNVANRDGGGIYCENKTCSINRCVIEANQVYGESSMGGGIYGDNLNVQSSSITSNGAEGMGGGVVLNGDDGDSSVMTNVTISNNSAITGGAIVFFSGDTQFNMVTIANNHAQQRAGGIFMRVGAQTEITNSIVAYNTVSTGTLNCEESGPINSFGFNIADDQSCNFVDSTDLITDPQLLPLTHAGNNATWVHPLAATSPAIDSGDLLECPTFDQVGHPRPFGSSCDRGAYEWIKSGVRNPGDILNPNENDMRTVF